MSYQLLDDNGKKIQFSKITSAQLTSLSTHLNATGVEGEPLYATDTKELYIHDGTKYIPLITNATPSSASDSGVKGQIAWDSNYIYICSATDTWLRVAIATW